MRTTRPHRSGIMLIEMLMAIILLSAFLLISTQVFVATMKLNAEAGKVHTDSVRLDSALRTLRADVWAAKEMSSRDGAVVLKPSTGPQEIRWMVEKDGTLVRTATRDGKTEQRRFPSELPGVTFEVKDPEVVLRVPDTRRARGGEVRLVSQIRLAERMAS